MGRRIIDDRKLLEMMKDGRTQKEAAEYFGVSEAAVSKRLKRLTPLPESLENLSDKERMFALGIAGGKSQTQAAFESFEVSNRASAKALGNQLMKKPSVNAAITDLMDYHGLSRFYRVGRLKTHVDNVDPNVSLKALDQSWKLDGAYTEEKPDIIINHNEQLRILNVKAKNSRREQLRLQAELLWIDDKITDKDYKDFLRGVYTEKNEFEIDNLYRHLLELSEIPEAVIEAEMEKFNGRMTGVLNQFEMDAEFEEVSGADGSES